MKTISRKRAIAGSTVAVLFLLGAGITAQLRAYDFSVVPGRDWVARVSGKTVHVQGRTLIVRVSKDQKDVGILTPQGWRTSFTTHDATVQRP